jgi:hypothetical protein
MAGLEPLAAIREIDHYNHGRTQRSPKLSHEGRLLSNPPVIIPEEMPQQTMRRIFQTPVLRNSADYQSIVALLTTYQRQSDNRHWDDFRNKIPPDLLKLWGDVMVECRRNGFIGPRVENGEIVWMQVIGTTAIRNGDLCTMCDRACRRREMIDTGATKQMRILNPGWREPKPCWERTDETPAH